MTKQIGPLLTVSDLNLMPDDGKRYELIEGEMVVSRAPGIIHQTISRNLLADLTFYLRQNRIGKAWATPGVIFSEFDGVIPDLVYVSNERFVEIYIEERLMGTPELLIEILSPGPENQRRDREVKRQLYSRYGVAEYWVIDGENKTVEIYCLIDNLLTLTSTLTEQGEIVSELLPGFRCLVGNLFE